MSAFGQFAASSQFYLFGKKHCTRTGYEKASKKYEDPDFLEKVELEGKCYMITGANSGVGKEVTQFLASKGATVYMVCRSPERAETARQEIIEKTKNEKVKVLLADVSLEADIRRIMKEFSEDHGETKLDALVCNAGAMAHERTLTSGGVEITFASHLLFGTYLLGYLAIPYLKAGTAADATGVSCGRLVVVSSGGMYNAPFPDWEIATAQKGSFNRQLAYAYAKRGQVLLCERWAREHPEVQCVSCHPGWTDTPAVNVAYSKFEKSLLEPMRSPWQGSEGIAWLCVANKIKVETGEFYLDRKPQVKHLAGPFFSEGSFTKNTTAQVDEMMVNLHKWSHGEVPTDSNAGETSTEQALGAAPPAPPPQVFATAAEARKLPLKAMNKFVDTQKFMGTWYVLANIPIPVVEVGLCNGTEIYTWDEETQLIAVNYKYTKPNKAGVQGKVGQFIQKAQVVNQQTNAEWKLTPKFGPFYAPVSLPYLILECADDYSHTIIGLPDRSLVWVMGRTSTVEPALMESLKSKVEDFGFDMKKYNVCVHTMDIADKEIGYTVDDSAGGDAEEEDENGAPEEAGLEAATKAAQMMQITDDEKAKDAEEGK